MGSNFAPRGHLAKSGDIFSCHKGVEGKGRGADVWWVEIRDAAQHPTMYRMVYTTKNYQPSMPIVPRLRRAELD